MFKAALLRFRRCEQGAITIDWVALVAGIALIGITLLNSIYTDGVASLTQDMNSDLDDAEVSVEPGLDLSQETFSK